MKYQSFIGYAGKQEAQDEDRAMPMLGVQAVPLIETTILMTLAAIYWDATLYGALC